MSISGHSFVPAFFARKSQRQSTHEAPVDRPPHATADTTTQDKNMYHGSPFTTVPIRHSQEGNTCCASSTRTVVSDWSDATLHAHPGEHGGMHGRHENHPMQTLREERSLSSGSLPRAELSESGQMMTASGTLLPPRGPLNLALHKQASFASGMLDRLRRKPVGQQLHQGAEHCLYEKEMDGLLGRLFPQGQNPVLLKHSVKVSKTPDERHERWEATVKSGNRDYQLKLVLNIMPALKRRDGKVLRHATESVSKLSLKGAGQEALVFKIDPLYTVQDELMVNGHPAFNDKVTYRQPDGHTVHSTLLKTSPRRDDPALALPRRLRQELPVRLYKLMAPEAHRILSDNKAREKQVKAEQLKAKQAKAEQARSQKERVAREKLQSTPQAQANTAKRSAYLQTRNNAVDVHLAKLDEEYAQLKKELEALPH